MPSTNARNRKQKLAFVVNHASFFVSHRLPIAEAAINEGWEVYLLTGRAASDVMEAGAEELLKAKGVKYKRVSFTASGLNPLLELYGLLQLVSTICRIKPDIIHTASPKGGIMGGIVARLCRVKKLVIAISGGGFLFTGEAKGLKLLLKRLFLTLTQWIYYHPNVTVIVQNVDDKRFVLDLDIIPDRNVVHIRGSGVPLKRFLAVKPEQSQPIVLLPARMVKDKGIYEFVEAARTLKYLGCNWAFLLVGVADYCNPESISSEQLYDWQQEGIIEWRGYQKDMLPFYAKAGIVCLPSYREGLPKCLLEAGAAGRAVVTFNSIGCREALLPGKTGELVQIGDSEGLVAALKKLIEDKALREKYGVAGRKLAQRRFGLDQVVEKTLKIYRD